jgi:hypothetical protein
VNYVSEKVIQICLRTGESYAGEFWLSIIILYFFLLVALVNRQVRAVSWSFYFESNCCSGRFFHSSSRTADWKWMGET